MQKEGAKPELSFIIKHSTSVLHIHLSPYTHLLQKHGEIKPEFWTEEVQAGGEKKQYQVVDDSHQCHTYSSRGSSFILHQLFKIL